MSESGGVIFYSSADYEFLRKNLGFTDDQPDGKLTKVELESESNKTFHDFYATNLTPKEKAILAAFTAKRPLTKRHVATDHGLMHIALKYIRFEENRRIIGDHDLPQTPDESRLNFDLRANAGFLVNRLTLDIPQIRAELSPDSWQLLISGNLGAYKTNTLRILRHFLKTSDQNLATDITFENWQSAYAAVVGCPIRENKDSIESTWNEMILMWQNSDPFWHAGTYPSAHLFWMAADEVYETLSGGLVRTGRVETSTDSQGHQQLRLKIGAKGVAAYIDHPEMVLLPVPQPSSKSKDTPLRRGQFAWEAFWPKNTATQITLGEKLGMALHLDARPDATITAYQEVQKSNLAFHAGRPLLGFNGFALNVDTSHFATKTLAKTVNAITGLFGKRYDVETLTPLAITVYQNRLCFVLRGQNHNRDLIKPLGSDFLFLDATPFLRSAIYDLDGTGRLANAFFSETGEVYSNVSVAELTQAILEALKLKTTPKNSKGPKLPSLETWDHRFFAEDVNADLTGLIKTWQTDFSAHNDVSDSALKIGTIRLEDGKFAGSGKIPQNFVLDGHIKMALALENNSSATVGTHNYLSVTAETHFDTSKRAGYVRLKLPETMLNGFGKGLDGNYAGEILIGLNLKNEDLFVDGRFSLDRFLAALSLNTLVDLQKNHHDFLLAAFELTEVVTSPETQTLEKIAARFNLALMENGKDLYGIIHNGQITVFKPQDDNIFTAPHLEVAAPDIMIGGLLQVFGKDAMLALYKDSDGTIYIKQILSEADISVETPLFNITGNLSGQANAKGSLPLIKFTSKGAGKSVTESEVPELPEFQPLPNILPQDFNESEFLDKLLRPLVDAMIRTPSTDIGLSYLFNRNFPYEALGGSINDATFVLKNLPLALEAEYEPRKSLKGRETIRIPLFSGLLSFLNPHIEKNSFLYTKSMQSLAEDGRLKEFRIDLNQPIRFLGFQITGIGVANLPCSPNDNPNRRLYLFTRHGKIDLMALIRLRYLFTGDVSKLYKDLRKQGVKVRPGEIPSNMDDFGRFLKGLIILFEFDKTLKKEDRDEAHPIEVHEFESLSRNQMESMAVALKKLSLPGPVPLPNNRAALCRFVNEIATDLRLAEIFKKNLHLFAPPQKGEAEDISDENLLVLYNKNGAALTQAERKKIIANNYRVLHLYLAPFLEQPDWLDFNHSEDLILDANLTPKKANYNIIEFQKDATRPFDLRLHYNPTDTEEQRSHPGAYLQVAPKPDDFIENARFNYKIPTLFLKADFHQIQGLEYYLGRATPDHSPDYSISVSNFVADDLEMTYMPPSLFNKPAFALFKANPGANGVANHFVGQSFKIDRYNQEVHSDVHVLQAKANNSYAYFYLGESEEARDMFLDLEGADLWDVETDILHHYNRDTKLYLASFSKITGFINLDNPPQNRPRGLIYLGTTEAGIRRHMILNKLEVKGLFDVVDDDLHAQAHIGFIATLPDYIYEAPLTLSLRKKGVDFKIQTVELDGTMDLILNETYGGFKKSGTTMDGLVAGEHKPSLDETDELNSLLPENSHLEDVTLKLRGSFRFQTKGSWITLTDLTIPVDECLLKITTSHTAAGAFISSVTLDSLQIPAGRPIESGVDMNVRSIPGSSSGTVHLDKGSLKLTTKSPFSYYTDQQNVPGFQTDGIDLTLNDAENRLDLSTGKISYLDNNGSIASITLDSEVKNQIYQLVVEMALQGKNLKFEL